MLQATAKATFARRGHIPGFAAQFDVGDLHLQSADTDRGLWIGEKDLPTLFEFVAINCPALKELTRRNYIPPSYIPVFEERDALREKVKQGIDDCARYARRIEQMRIECQSRDETIAENRKDGEAMSAEIDRLKSELGKLRGELAPFRLTAKRYTDAAAKVFQPGGILHDFPGATAGTHLADLIVPLAEKYKLQAIKIERLESACKWLERFESAKEQRDEVLSVFMGPNSVLKKWRTNQTVGALPIMVRTLAQDYNEAIAQLDECKAELRNWSGRQFFPQFTIQDAQNYVANQTGDRKYIGILHEARSWKRRCLEAERLRDKALRKLAELDIKQRAQTENWTDGPATVAPVVQFNTPTTDPSNYVQRQVERMRERHIMPPPGCLFLVPGQPVKIGDWCRHASGKDWFQINEAVLGYQLPSYFYARKAGQ